MIQLFNAHLKRPRIANLFPLQFRLPLPRKLLLPKLQDQACASSSEALRQVLISLIAAIAFHEFLGRSWCKESKSKIPTNQLRTSL